MTAELRALFATVACVIDNLENRRKRKISGQMSGRSVSYSKSRKVRIDADWVAIDIVHETEKLVQLKFEDGSDRAVVGHWQPGEPVWHGFVDGEEVRVQVRPVLNGYRLGHRGADVLARVFTPREAELMALMPLKAAAGSSKELLCPMPGLVVALHVAEGAEVKAGDPLAIVEAMKMQNVLRAERDGKVSKIHAEVGESLGVDAVIMEFA